MTETTEGNQLPETEPQPEAQETVTPAETDKPQGDLAAEAATLKDRLLRTMAEMENLRKRAEREKQDASKYAVTAFARDLLNVSDNLRRALESLPEGPEGGFGEGAVKAFVDGIEMTERELLRAFEKAGIRKIEPMGEKFDHNFHEAMFEVPMADQPAGTIIQVVQAGYVLHDRLLRPARVGVSRAADTPAASDQRVDTRA